MPQKKKNTNKLAAITVGLIFVIGLLSAYFYIRLDNDFAVVFSHEHQTPGFEKSQESVRVYASPAIKASQANPALVAIGWVMVLIMIAGTWWVATDRYLGNAEVGETKSVEWRAWVAVVLPLLLAAVFWFAPHGASLDMGSLVVTTESLQYEYGISPETIGELRLGNTRHIQDESGLLTTYFTKK